MQKTHLILHSAGANGDPDYTRGGRSSRTDITKELQWVDKVRSRSVLLFFRNARFTLDVCMRFTTNVMRMCTGSAAGMATKSS